MKVGTSRKLSDDLRCVNCGAKADGSTSVGEEDACPSAGDFTVCLYCGHLMVFGEEALSLRSPTAAEMREIAGNPLVIAIQKARGGKLP